MWCCVDRKPTKQMFVFENGTHVRAQSYDEAVLKLRSARFITRSEQNTYEYSPDIYIHAKDCNDAGWRLYLDKKEPTLRRR
jgi:hypothetical protein